jgi:hypothetical protein
MFSEDFNLKVLSPHIILRHVYSIRTTSLCVEGKLESAVAPKAKVSSHRIR